MGKSKKDFRKVQTKFLKFQKIPEELVPQVIEVTEVLEFLKPKVLRSLFKSHKSPLI